ncbi:MAG: hypothetical protein ACRD2A_22920 [Vicinamibacterales bacterium]
MPKPRGLPRAGAAESAHLHADAKFRRAAEQVANKLAKSLGL